MFLFYPLSAIVLFENGIQPSLREGPLMTADPQEDSSETTVREELAADLLAYFGEPYALESDPGPVLARQVRQEDGKILATVGLNERLWSHPTPARCAQLAALTLVHMSEDDAFASAVDLDDETHQIQYRLAVKNDQEIWDKYVQPFHPHNLLPLLHHGLLVLWRHRHYLPVKGDQEYTDLLIVTMGKWLGDILDAIDRGEIGTGDDKRPLRTRFSDVNEGKDDFPFMLHSVITACMADPMMEEGQELPPLESDIQALESRDRSAVARTLWKLCTNPSEDLLSAIADAGHVPMLRYYLRDAASQTMHVRAKHYDATVPEWVEVNETHNQVIDAFVDALAALDEFSD